MHTFFFCRVYFESENLSKPKNGSGKTNAYLHDSR